MDICSYAIFVDRPDALTVWPFPYSLCARVYVEHSQQLFRTLATDATVDLATTAIEMPLNLY